MAVAGEAEAEGAEDNALEERVGGGWPPAHPIVLLQ